MNGSLTIQPVFLSFKGKMRLNIGGCSGRIHPAGGIPRGFSCVFMLKIILCIFQDSA